MSHLKDASKMTKVEARSSAEFDWDLRIIDACDPDDQWMAQKFIKRLRDHKRKYPNFRPERVAEMFISATPKVRAWYCYRPLSEFTKTIHRAKRLASLADSQD